jgi:exonuclease VII large subunit
MPRNELDPNQVMLNLLALSRSMQQLSDELDELEKNAVEEKENYTLAYAKAFLSNSGAVEVRKQQTLLDTSEQRLASELAETLVKAHKRKIDTLRVRIDVGRSAAALVRAESELLRVGR